MNGWKKWILAVAVIIVLPNFLSACGQKDSEITMSGAPEQNVENSVSEAPKEEAPKEEIQIEEIPVEDALAGEIPNTITQMEWGEYFSDLNGCAVFYDTSAHEYKIYNQALCEKRRSPCSTFKIVSSLIGLESGIINPKDSIRVWNGEKYWNEDWNRDIEFADAFRTSCVWYFRQVIDEIGEEAIQQTLDALAYGNCDISDWQGIENNNNSNRSLTGFWLESSLQISPMEQVVVLERIFGEDSDYAEETIRQLKQVMQTTEAQDVYGKTGTGQYNGKTVDAWFVGLMEKEGNQIYFCVYLGENSEEEISGIKAKEIALQILSKEW